MKNKGKKPNSNQNVKYHTQLKDVGYKTFMHAKTGQH